MMDAAAAPSSHPRQDPPEPARRGPNPGHAPGRRSAGESDLNLLPLSLSPSLRLRLTRPGTVTEEHPDLLRSVIIPH